MMPNRKKQQGFSLFIVVVVLIVIALLVMVTVQSSSSESRSSSNDADRKFALSSAEDGLRNAESMIKANAEAKKVMTFYANCTDGLCRTVTNTHYPESTESDRLFRYDGNGRVTVEAIQRCGTGSMSKPCTTPNTVLDKGDKGNRSITAKGSNTQTIIEYMGQKKAEDGSLHDYFRITSRAKGENSDTIVTLQSYVELYNE